MTDASQRFTTLVEVPPDHPGHAMGCTRVHIAAFEPADDAPGLGRSVVVQVPEALHRFDEAMRVARKSAARVAFICDTDEQADAIAERAAEALPGHRRVAIERWMAGQYGRGH